MTKELLEIEIKRYFTIAIKKLLVVNKSKLVEIEQKQNTIKNSIQSLELEGLDYSFEIDKLNNDFKELELLKPNIDYKKLSISATTFYFDKYKFMQKVEVENVVNKVCYYFRKNNYTLQSFKLYHNISSKKSYKKMKELRGEEVLSGKEKALKTAEIKREKSFNLVKSVYMDLLKSGVKGTSNNVYQTIKNNFNDCLKERQIKTYLKQIKEIDCKNMSINEIENVINMI